MTLLRLLIRRLRDVGVDLDVEAVSDALWLAAAISGEPSTRPEATRQPSAGALNAAITSGNEGGGGRKAEPSDTPGPSEKSEEGSEAEEREGVYDAIRASDVPRKPATAVYVRDARALPHPLPIARALRPFKRLFPDAQVLELDVDATVHGYADSRILVPMFRSAPARRFYLDLVLDAGPSMLVWQELANELVELIRQTGAFRLVRVWRFDVSQPNCTLLDSRGQPAAPAILRDPYAHRVIVVISDCVSEGWYRPSVWKALYEWSASTPTLLLNPLPIRLWRHTALDAPPVRLLPSLAGARNIDLGFTVPTTLQLITGNRSFAWRPLPTAGLSPFSLGQWARTVMDADAAGCDGVLVPATGRLRLNGGLGEKLDEDFGAPPPTAVELVESFRLVASPPASRLADLCSTHSTISLPLLRLIQRELVPEAQVSDIAEVIVGGLFEQITSDNPHELWLRFRNGVREQLQQSLPTSDAWAVYWALTQFIERETGHGKTFPAAVADPRGEIDLPENLAPFADASRETLRLLGVSHDTVTPPRPAPRSAPLQEATRPPTATEPPRAASGQPLLTDTVDLEIELYRRDARTWSVELRSSSPRTDTVRVSDPASTTFDIASLQELTYDKDEYGRVLGDNLFKAKGIGSAFKEARDEAARSGLPLRTRLFVGPSAVELHGLLWETIRDPEADVPLLMNENVRFSRYLTSVDWRPVGVRRKVDLRAVVLVANPSDVEDYRTEDRPLPPIDVDAELEQARVGLRDLGLSPAATTELVGNRCSLGALSDALRRGCDILYVVCHGFVAGGKPQLLLEDGSGKVERVPAEDFVSRLRELQRCPRLVVLVSYRSAGAEQRAGEEGSLAALGPQLAEAGVPAVVAMQGDVSTATVATFIPSFFKELKHDGKIDVAMAVARVAVRHRPDWWAPALFMRLKTGRLWYAPGFGQPFEKWAPLLNSIANGRCTPILGPGVTDSYIGSRQEIARRWASAFHFPMAAPDHSLPKVAQYLAVNQDYSFPYEEFQKYIGTELLVRYGRDLPDSVYALGRDTPERISAEALDKIFAAVAEVRRRDPEFCEPHSVLAELPIPLFVTTQPTDLMEEALRTVGKQPERELCRWQEDYEDVPWPASVFEHDAGYQPDERRPLVFHPFGHFQCPGSLVLTEDDYLNFLTWSMANRDLIPTFVRKRLSSTALLFLGFPVDEWDFRVIFRSLVNQAGRSRRARLTHVLITEEPADDEPERTRKYLDDYFRAENISIYWGGVENFMWELGEQWRKSQGGA